MMNPKRQIVSRRALLISFGFAVLTQAAFIGAYYVETDGCFCSYHGPPPAPDPPPWIYTVVETASLPATAVLDPAGIGLYVLFNLAFWTAAMLALFIIAGRIAPRPARSAS